MQPIQTSCTGCQFCGVNVAVDPEGRFVNVSAGALPCDDQNPNGSVFVAAAQLAQLDQVGSGACKVLEQLSQFGMLVKAIECWLGQLSVVWGSVCHGGVQKSIEQAVSITRLAQLF